MTEKGFSVRDTRGRFFWLDNALLDNFGTALGPLGIAVYCALARRANNSTQECDVSFGGIAALTGVSRRQVMREVEKLVDLGLVAIEKRDHRPSLYTLLRVQPSDSQSPGERELVTDSHQASDSQSPDLPKLVTVSHPNKTNKTNKTIGASSRPRDLLFETLCAVCGHDHNAMTRIEKAPVNAARKALAEAGYGPAEVRRMAASWKRLMGSATMTPTAIAKYASRLLGAGEKQGLGEGYLPWDDMVAAGLAEG